YTYLRIGSIFQGFRTAESKMNRLAAVKVQCLNQLGRLLVQESNGALMLQEKKIETITFEEGC
ncbi:hypothetical protein HDU98_003745, partial [Podochytrium sp. JEL0797]